MTKHEFITADSRSLFNIGNSSVNLIITSPPYPMIQMWDNLFIGYDDSIDKALKTGSGKEAYDKMHSILADVWHECDRVLKDGGFICINIGSAVRTLKDRFCLYPNQSKIVDFFSDLDYNVLPDVIWRKPSNAPNKFMGSGMYPAGAYVTYEHEYVLIFRKGKKRIFNEREIECRKRSAYFWEERNVWFSDLWEIKGTVQKSEFTSTRKRSASFPFEIPYRLVNMYSIEGDTVLDPFCGLGTTNIACMAANRNSIGVDIDSEIISAACQRVITSIGFLNNVINLRIKKHLNFIDPLSSDKKESCYYNSQHNFLVKTKQETNLHLRYLKEIKQYNAEFVCEYDGEKIKE